MSAVVDPIELELMRNLFEAAAEEMGLTLQRVAFSANIKERRDFSCALFDDRGRLLAQAAHIPVHLGSMPASVAAVLDKLGPLRPGDTAVVNDPFAGGTHLPDITLVTPIYAKDDGGRMKDEPDEASPGSSSSFSLHPSSLVLVGYAANRAHHADVGGITPGSMTLSRHIDEEGFRIEPALLTPDLRDRFLAAVRTPDERVGDLDAQLAANHVGAAALQRIIDRHGLPSVRTYAAALLDYSHAFMSRAIAAIPDGTYSFEDFLDDDGAGTDRIPLRVTLTVAGDQATVDLTASADQVPGCVNCPAAVTASAVYYCFACLLEESVPLNEGCFRNIRVLTRPGSVLHALYPAAVVAGNVETSQRVVDIVFGALSRALPDRIPAASCGTMSSLALGSPSLATGNSQPATAPWTYYETIGGGSGASPVGPGASAVQCHMTNTWNTPAEAIELQYALRVRRFERVPNTGGHGRHPGGDGIIRELELLAPAEGTLLTDRRLTRPYGLAGGSPASPGFNAILSPDGTCAALPPKARFAVQAGDTLRIITPGGGGWGSTG